MPRSFDATANLADDFSVFVGKSREKAPCNFSKSALPEKDAQKINYVNMGWGVGGWGSKVGGHNRF